MGFSTSATAQSLRRCCSSRSLCYASRTNATFSTSATRRLSTRRPSDKLNYNPEVFGSSVDEYAKYDLVTANDLEGHTTPPKRVKMLVRDFIEDSLYNPNYGYFPQQATIFTSSENQIDFGSIRDSNEFQNQVARRYAEYDVNAAEDAGKQLWHTPTELFKVCSLRISICNCPVYTLTAMVRSSTRPVSRVRVSAEVFSLRGFYYLRNWSWKRDPCDGYSQLLERRTSWSLRAHKIPNYWNQW